MDVIVIFSLVNNFMIFSLMMPTYQAYLVEKLEPPIGEIQLKLIFNSADIYNAFMKFLQDEFATENLLFYERVQEYRSNPPENQEEILRQALDIRDTYVAEYASMQINIQHELREGLLSALERFESGEAQGTETLLRIFDRTQQEVYDLMNADSFRRFKNSSIFRVLKHVLSNYSDTSLSLLTPSKSNPHSSSSLFGAAGEIELHVIEHKSRGEEYLRALTPRSARDSVDPFFGGTKPIISPPSPRSYHDLEDTEHRPRDPRETIDWTLVDPRNQASSSKSLHIDVTDSALGISNSRFTFVSERGGGRGTPLSGGRGTPLSGGRGTPLSGGRGTPLSRQIPSSDLSPYKKISPTAISISKLPCSEIPEAEEDNEEEEKDKPQDDKPKADKSESNLIEIIESDKSESNLIEKDKSESNKEKPNPDQNKDE